MNYHEQTSFAHRSCRPFAILADYCFQRKYACIVRLPAPPPLVSSASIRLHTEASFTPTRKLLKQHWEHFQSSKRNDVDNRAVFPDSITPKQRVRAQVRPPLTSLYTEQYSAPGRPRSRIALPSTTYENATLLPWFSMGTGIGNKGKASITSLRSDTSLRRTHTHVITFSYLSGCVFQTAPNLPTPRDPFSRFFV